MRKIIVAPKREFRNLVSMHWQDEISKIKGVEILSTGPRQVRLEATPEAIEEIYFRLESKFNIEQMVAHYKMA